MNNLTSVDSRMRALVLCGHVIAVSGTSTCFSPCGFVKLYEQQIKQKKGWGQALFQIINHPLFEDNWQQLRTDMMIYRLLSANIMAATPFPPNIHDIHALPARDHVEGHFEHWIWATWSGPSYKSGGKRASKVSAHRRGWINVGWHGDTSDECEKHSGGGQQQITGPIFCNKLLICSLKMFKVMMLLPGLWQRHWYFPNCYFEHSTPMVAAWCCSLNWQTVWPACQPEHNINYVT